MFQRTDMEQWIHCTDNSHLKRSRIIGVRINSRAIGEDTFAVVAEIDTSSPKRSPLRDLYEGSKEDCEAYLADFLSAEDNASGEGEKPTPKTSERKTSTRSRTKTTKDTE